MVELPNIITLLAERVHDASLSKFLLTWENVIFSLIIIFALSLAAYAAGRKIASAPGRVQVACELFVGGVDYFAREIIGPKGRKYVPFIGTLFIYILVMNLAAIVPLMKSPTTSWSTTLALAICVFLYVQYTAVRELGIVGYIDYLMGRPRGIIAFTVFVPVLMLFIHIVSELVRPLSLSLRLRSNIWGDDMLLAVLAGFGLKGVLLFLFNTFLVILASIVQAFVFCLLTSVYFALVLVREET